jgi:hypothetical protein
MVGSNHLEHRLYQAISHLINELDYLRGETTLAHVRGLENQLALIKDLFAIKSRDDQARQELNRITAEIREIMQKRNVFASMQSFEERFLLIRKHKISITHRKGALRGAS